MFLSQGIELCCVDEWLNAPELFSIFLKNSVESTGPQQNTQRVKLERPSQHNLVVVIYPSPVDQSGVWLEGGRDGERGLQGAWVAGWGDMRILLSFFFSTGGENPQLTKDKK